MSRHFSIEFEVPGMDWDEMTELLFVKTNWRRLKSCIRYCKRNNLKYKIRRWR